VRGLVESTLEGQGKNTRKKWRDCTYWTALHGLIVKTAKCIHGLELF
jgi:hypothetical protein